jgi:hypothetical protein
LEAQARISREQLDRQERLSREQLATKEREAREVARYEAAQRAAERIMDLLVQMDKARLAVWEPERSGAVDESVRAAAFAAFRETLPMLQAAVRLARMVPLSVDAVEYLDEVDAAAVQLPDKHEKFHTLGDERERLNDAFDRFLGAVGHMAP